LRNNQPASQEAAAENVPEATAMMNPLEAALNMEVGRYELSLSDPWHYFVFIHVLQAQPETLGLAIEVEYMKRGWTVPLVQANDPETVFCDNFSMPFFYKGALSQLSPRLDLDKVPHGGLAIVTIKAQARATKQQYQLDMASPEAAATLNTLRLREAWYRNIERCYDVKYQERLLDCFQHKKWSMPTTGCFMISHLSLSDM
jgi:hypothetical protein